MAATAILGAIPSLLGGLSGLFNKRPPALNPAQSGALNSLIPYLQNQAMQTPQIDPTQQNLMYGNVAANQTGAANAATNMLTSRGLGHSGLLGDALTQVANQAQQSRNAGNMQLQQQAIQRQQFDLQTLLGLLNVNTTPGQSGAGAFMAGMAPIAAYSIQNMLNNRGSMNAGGGTYGMGNLGNLPLSPNGGGSLMDYGSQGDQ